jgi:hypothetical protein
VIRVQAFTGDLALILWKQFADYFEKAALEHPAPYSLEEMRAKVADGSMLSVGIFDGVGMIGAAGVEIVEQRDGRTLHVAYLAGDSMEMWLEEMQARLIEIARAYDCRWLSLTGRQGWRKTLARLGWNPIAIQLRCEVPI